MNLLEIRKLCLRKFMVIEFPKNEVVFIIKMVDCDKTET